MDTPQTPKIQMFPVASSQISEIGHDPNTNTMAIRFKSGGLYHYANVTRDEFDAFKNAPSIGSYFYKNIKPNADRFPYTRVGEPERGAA